MSRPPTVGSIAALLLLLALPVTSLSAQENRATEAAPGGQEGPDDRRQREEERKKAVESEEINKAPTVTVYGEQIPGSIQRVEVAGDERVRTEDVGRVLQRVPGFHLLDELGTGLWSNVAVRGVSPLRSRGLLTLLDGAPAMLSLFGDNDWHVLPSTEQLDHIEIVKGGAAVLYGPNAIGGVVNFITKGIPEEPSGSVRATFGSDNLLIGEVSGGGVFDGTALSTSYVHKQTDGWREHSELDTDDILLKLGGRVGERGDLRVNFNYFQSVSETPGALSPDEFRRDPSRSFTPNDEFRGHRFASHVQYTHELRDDEWLQTNFYAQRMERRWRIARRSTTSADLWDLTGTFAGFEPKYFLTWDGPWGRPNELTAGLRLHAERSQRVKLVTTSPSANTGAASLIDVWDAVEVAPYVQNDFEVADDLHVTAGFRLESYRLTISNQIVGVKGESTVHEPIWGLGSTLRAGDGTFFASVNRYLDPPQPQEEIDTTTGQRRFLDNAVGMNYELGVRSQHVAWLPFDLTLFNIDYKDQVVRQGLVYSNAGRSSHRGAELAFTADAAALDDRLEGLELFGNATYLRAKIESGKYDGNYLAYAPKTTFNGGVRYAHAESGLSGYFEGIYTGRQFSDPANTVAESADGAFGRIAARTIYNVGVTYEHPESGVSVFAGVKNLFDERYVSMRWIWWGGKFPGAARSLFFGMALRF